MRVAIADDSGLFRAGLAAVLNDLGAQVVTQARTADALMEGLAASRRTVDVLVTDIRMPPTFTDEGLKLALAVRAQPDAPAVVLLSTYAESGYAARLLAGTPRKVGYLLKDRVDDPAMLLEALARVIAGEVVIDPSLVTRLMEHQRLINSLAQLTDQERRVLQLVSEGRSNDGIARLLWITPKTVETHVGRVFAKLGIGQTPDDNRRVLATLTWLRNSGN